MQSTLSKNRGILADRRAYRMLIWPSFIVLFVLTIIPLMVNFYLAFTNTTITTMDKARFIGLDNFIRIFTKDKYFGEACLVTVKLVVGTVSLQILFGMLVALLWNTDFKGTRICRLLHLIPMMITGIVAGFIWRMLLNTDMGVVNYLLKSLGVATVNWLGDETAAVYSVIITNLWVGTPFVTIILLSALQGVDDSFLEAALIDGANKVQIFFRVVLPIIRPSLLLAIMFRLMDAIRQYDLIDALTYGGPGTATMQLNLYTYQVGFMQWRMGYGAALATIILVIILICSLTFMHFINKSNTD
ncbi:MAG: sugar ABC transporter permease [Clostridia bacterium]|nr:sugar ABC transporter permease [Clostridia bacterium]